MGKEYWAYSLRLGSLSFEGMEAVLSVHPEVTLAVNLDAI